MCTFTRSFCLPNQKRCKWDVCLLLNYRYIVDHDAPKEWRKLVLQLTASPWTTEASTKERWQLGALTNRKVTSSNRAPSLSSLYYYKVARSLYRDKWITMIRLWWLSQWLVTHGHHLAVTIYLHVAPSTDRHTRLCSTFVNSLASNPDRKVVKMYERYNNLLKSSKIWAYTEISSCGANSSGDDAANTKMSGQKEETSLGPTLRHPKQKFQIGSRCQTFPWNLYSCASCSHLIQLWVPDHS